MSGRTKWVRDGQVVTGHRKTDRRQSPQRPLKERLHDVALAGAGEKAERVRLAFMLPESLHALMSTGELEDGVRVLARGFVRVTSWSAEKCFMRLQQFFRDVAKDRAAFTITAVVINSEQPGQRYTRHITVVRGAMVVSAGGLIEPKVFEAV
jgi:hypothetical protein